MIRLRDEAVLLEPAVKVDPYTEEEKPDWTKEPLSATPTAFQGQPVSSEEAVLTAQTVISRWKGWLSPEWDGIVTPTFRIRWDGVDYEIDGAVERWKSGRSVRYLTVLLKHVDG